MRIKIIAPIITDQFNDNIKEEAERFTSSHAQIEVENIARGAASIESTYDEVLNAPDVVAAAVRAEKDGFDGVFVDCFGDPGVDAARECVRIPVVGGFQPAVLTVRLLTDRFSIVTVLSNVVPILRANIRREGMDGNVASVRTVDMAVLDLTDPDALKETVGSEAETAVREDGAEGIVLGCTGMLGLAEAVQEMLADRGFEVPVVDPTGAALGCLLNLHRNAISHSKRTYPPPPPKERNTERAMEGRDG
ncbi:MAG: aspartate/glutamate racemase family protein [Spirochaetaceae bacterium]